MGTHLSYVALGEGPQMHSGTWQNFLSRHPPTVTHVEQALLVSLQPDPAPQVTAQSCRPHGPSLTPSAAVPAASGPCEDPHSLTTSRLHLLCFPRGAPELTV